MFLCAQSVCAFAAYLDGPPYVYEPGCLLNYLHRHRSTMLPLISPAALDPALNLLTPCSISVELLGY